jgi:hypothetical protein
MKDGSVHSVSSVAENLIVFSATKTATKPRPEQYELSFTIDNKYERPEGGRADKSQSKDLVKKTRRMFLSNIQQLEDDSILQVEAYGKDDAGSKRKNIYTKMGFDDLPGVNESLLWAKKTKGGIAPIGRQEKWGLARIVYVSKSDSFSIKADKKRSL